MAIRRLPESASCWHGELAVAGAGVDNEIPRGQIQQVLPAADGERLNAARPPGSEVQSAWVAKVYLDGALTGSEREFLDGQHV